MTSQETRLVAMIIFSGDLDPQSRGGGVRHFDLREYRRIVQFTDEPMAHTVTDAYLAKVGGMAEALSGQAVQRWRRSENRLAE